MRGDQGEGLGKRDEGPWGERREEGKVLKKMHDGRAVMSSNGKSSIVEDTNTSLRLRSFDS